MHLSNLTGKTQNSKTKNDGAMVTSNEIFLHDFFHLQFERIKHVFVRADDLKVGQLFD